MKGQFMLISSILIGIIVISTASTVSKVQSHDLDTQELSNTAEIIEQEAEKIDTTEMEEREKFREMVSMLSSYRTETVYWKKGADNCFNVTLRSSEQEVFLRCIG